MNDQPQLRQRQAARTHAEIVSAARELFIADGYANTSIAAIAAGAGVAVPTVYKVMGTKAAILTELVEQINSDETVASLRARLGSAQTPTEILHVAIELMTSIHDRQGAMIRVIIAAADVEPIAVAARDLGFEFHRRGTAAVAQRLGALDALQPSLTDSDAAAILNVMTSYFAYNELVTSRGMTIAEAGAWLEKLLAQILLKS